MGGLHAINLAARAVILVDRPSVSAPRALRPRANPLSLARPRPTRVLPLNSSLKEARLFEPGCAVVALARTTTHHTALLQKLARRGCFLRIERLSVPGQAPIFWFRRTLPVYITEEGARKGAGKEGELQRRREEQKAGRGFEFWHRSLH